MRRILNAALAIAALAVASCQERPPPLSPPPDASAPDASALASADASSEPAPAAPATTSLFEGVRWSPSGSSLATWGGCSCSDSEREGGELGSCPVRIWDFKRGLHAVTIDAPCAKQIRHVGWSPSQEMFVVSDYDTLRAFRPTDGTPLFATEPMALSGVSQFSPDGQLILRGNLYGNAELLRSADGKVIRRAEILTPGADQDWHAEWSDDGRFLSVAAIDQPFWIWDGRTGAPLRKLRFRGVKEPVDATHYAWLPDNKRIVLASDSGLLGIADATTGAVSLLRKPKPDGPAPRQTWISLGADGKRLAVNNGDGRVELWDLPSRLSTELLAPLESSWTSPVDFSDDLRYLALLRQNKLEIVPVDKPDEARRFDIGPEPSPFQLVGWGPGDRYLAVRGKTLVSLSPDGTEGPRYELPNPNAGLHRSPRGGFLAVVDKHIDIVRLRDGRSIQLTLRDVGGRMEGEVKGSPDPAALGAFFDQTP